MKAMSIPFEEKRCIVGTGRRCRTLPNRTRCRYCRAGFQPDRDRRHG
jgi:hypothetical protein